MEWKVNTYYGWAKSKIKNKIQENRSFNLSTLQGSLSQIPQSFLSQIMTKNPKYKMICVPWMPKNFTDVYNMKWIGGALGFWPITQ